MQKSLIDTLIAWAPLLLLIGVWIFFMQRMRGRGGQFDKQMKLLEEQLEQVRRQNRVLERIATALEHRNR